MGSKDHLDRSRYGPVRARGARARKAGHRADAGEGMVATRAQRRASLSGKLEGAFETPVLDRLGDVGDGYRRFAGEVGYGARELEHPVISTRREMELADSLSQQRAGAFFRRAEAFDFARAEPGVAFALARQLPLMRAFRAFPDLRGILAATRVNELVFAHGGHLDLDIDAIEQRPRELVTVACHLVGRASAFAAEMPQIAARAGIHRTDQLEP